MSLSLIAESKKSMHQESMTARTSETIARSSPLISFSMNCRSGVRWSHLLIEIL